MDAGVKHRTWVEATNAGPIARVKCLCGWRMTANNHDEGTRYGEAHKKAHRLRSEGRL